MTIAEQGPLHRGTLGYGTFADTYGDDPYDQEMIELGYDYYDRTHTGKEVSYFKEFREAVGEELVDEKGEFLLDIVTEFLNSK